MAIRLLQSGSKRLLQEGSNLLLQGDLSLVARPCVAAYRHLGPLPNVAAHFLLTSRMDKITSTPALKNHQVVYLPGGGGLESSWQGGTTTNPLEVNAVVRDCADRGIHRRRLVTLPTDYTWGDAAMMTRIDDMLAFAESDYGFSPPYHLIGVSMGTLCSLNWAVRNPDKIQSVSLLLGMVNPRGFAGDGRLTGGTGNPSYEPPVIDPSVAYGGAVPTTYNPLSRLTEYAGMPIKMWQSNNDSVCYLSEATTFAAANGAEIVNIGDQGPALGIVGHGLDTGFTSTQVNDFLIAHD